MYTLLIAFFAIAILFSFLCSLWEAVLLSVTPAYAQIQQEKGSALGQRLQEFKKDIDRPLAAILTLNTVAHTVGAIGVGNQAAAIWADENPLITQLAIPAAMTLAVLLLSEIIPKTLGALYWQRLAPFTVSTLSWAMWLLSPLVWLSERITKLLKKDTAGSIFSRHDFVAMAQIGVAEGVIGKADAHIIDNLLRLETVLANDAMTPATVVVSASQEQSIAEFHRSHPKLRFSRIPVWEGQGNHVTGYVLRSAVMEALLDGHGDQPLASLRRDIPSFQTGTPLPEVFDRLLAAREHIAVVMGEFGGMAGIISTEDVIETLLGLEIVDETDIEIDMRELARKNWRRRASKLGLTADDTDTQDRQV